MIAAWAGVASSCATTGAAAPKVDDRLCDCAARRGFDRATLELGRRHYVGECARCHSPVAPTDFTEREWKDILHRMRDKSKLSDADMAAVSAYINAAIDASAPAPGAP